MIKRFTGIRSILIIATFVLMSGLSGLTAASASASIPPSALAAAGSTETLINNSAGECLNGYIGSAHAEVTVTPCNTGDFHMVWVQDPNSTEEWFNLVNQSNLDCLNGYIGSAHAEVTMTPCNTSDTHMQWVVWAEVSSGGSNWFILQNRSNNDCLNGYNGTAHAEVTMTPCNTSDTHMQWQQF
jgi:Ricin-type beta-trefoil lectin domain